MVTVFTLVITDISALRLRQQLQGIVPVLLPVLLLLLRLSGENARLVLRTL
jgi:hypothetical protein